MNARLINLRHCLLSLGLSIAFLYLHSVHASELIENVKAGDIETVKQLLKDGIDVNAPESNGTTALHWAVHYGEDALVNALLNAGADPNVMNNYGATPLSEATLIGSISLVKNLLDAGAKVDKVNQDGMSALMIAARSNHILLAKLLLEHGAQVNLKEKWKQQNAIIWAAAQSQPEMLRVLLAAGGDPNSQSMDNERDRYVTQERRFQWRPAGGMSALAYAAREGCLECVRLLIQEGANLDEGDAENVTPLNLAIMNMHFDTAAYLIKAGANVNKWSLRGENPLYSAVDVNTLPHGGYPDRPSVDNTTPLEIIEMLLEAGANPNLQLKLQPTYRHLKDDRGADRMLSIGATPLLRAAKGHDIPAVELLLKYDAKVDLSNREGITPIMAAAGLGANSIDTRGDYITPLADQLASATVSTLLAGGADITRRDQLERTALHGAASWGWSETVRILADSGVDLEAKDAGGISALDVTLGKTSGNVGRGGMQDPRPETATVLREILSKSNQTSTK